MRKLCLLLLMAVIVRVTAEAAEIRISEVSGHPGDVVNVSVAMTGDDVVTAADFTIPLGAGLEYVAGSVILSDRAASHQVAASTVDGALRIVVYSLDLSAISGTDGELLSFKLLLGNKPETFALTPEVILSNVMGESIPTTASSGSVTTLSPELTIITGSVDFGHIPIRSVYKKNIILSNSGNEPLTINSLTPGTDALAVEEQLFTIPAGGTANATLCFSPVERGAFADKVTVDCNAVNNLVHGKRQVIDVVADPFSVNEFHLLRTEGVSDSEITVSARVNNMEPLVGLQFTINLPDELKYVEGSAAPTERAEGTQVAASVNGNKLTVLLFSLTNTPFTGNDGELITFKLRLQGRSGWYYLNPSDVILSNEMSENMTSAVSGEYVVIKSPTISGDSSLDFGQQSVTETMTADYSVYNSGQVSLVVDRLTFLAEGFSVATELPLVVEPYQSKPLTIEYVTDERGKFSTTMNIYSNDPEMRMKSVSVKGAGYSPNELTVAGEYVGDEHNYKLSVGLENHAEIAGVQFDIFTDPAAVTGKPVIAKSDRLTDQAVTIADMGGGRWRVLMYSFSNTAIEPGTGEIVSITFPRAASVYTSFNIDKQVLSNTEGENVVSPIFKYSPICEFLVPTAVNLDRTDVAVEVFDTIKLVATVLPEDEAVRWSSSDDTVATVDADGVVTARAGGEAVITATAWNGLSAACTFTVSKKSHEIVWNTDVALHEGNGTTITLDATTTSDLPEEVLYEVTEGKEYGYVEGNILYLTGDEPLKVTAWHPGNAQYLPAEPAVKPYWCLLSSADAVTGRAVVLIVDNGVLQICGLPDDRVVRVYNLGGSMVYCGLNRRISLPEGAYVVDYGFASKKIIVD